MISIISGLLFMNNLIFSPCANVYKPPRRELQILGTPLCMIANCQMSVNPYFQYSRLTKNLLLRWPWRSRQVHKAVIPNDLIPNIR